MSYRHALNQTIQIANITGNDADDTNDYGEAITDTLENTPARVDFVNKNRPGANGEVIVISAKVLVMPDTVVNTGDKVVFDGNNYKVEGVLAVPGANGVIQAKTLECSEWR